MAKNSRTQDVGKKVSGVKLPGMISRRAFIKRAGILTTGAVAGLPLIVSAGATGRSSPCSRIALGMIGFGRQAKHANLKPFLTSPDVQVVAVCDVDSWRLNQGREEIDDYYGGLGASGVFHSCAGYRDYRELLAREDIDAVIISTPDHWHATMSIDAAKAGKDVSCEKPITLTLHEGRLICDAIRQYSRIFITDTEVRSVRTFQRACELVLNGRIGRLRKIKSGVPHEHVVAAQAEPATPPPAELDYDMWLGPAPVAPYSEERVHNRNDLNSRPGWMQVRDYCDGMICNWGTHLNDIVQWGNGTELTGPVEIEARGRYAEHDLFNVLVDFEADYRYASGVSLNYKMDRPFVRFEGDEGWIEADYSTLKASDERLLKVRPKPEEIHLPLISEKRDFIECIKTRRRPVIDAEVGHRTTSLCHLAHISIQLGGAKLRWDPDHEIFINNVRAEELKCRQAMRPPWKL